MTEILCDCRHFHDGRSLAVLDGRYPMASFRILADPQLPYPVGPFDLSNVFTPEELAVYSRTDFGAACFRNQRFDPIGGGFAALELCKAVQVTLLGKGACSSCPVRQSLPTLAHTDELVQLECDAAIICTVGSIKYRDSVLGFLSGPQLPTRRFQNEFLARLREEDRSLVEKRFDLVSTNPDVRDRIKDWVARTRNRLTTIASERIQERAFGRACEQFEKARDPKDLLTKLFDGLEVVFPEADLCAYQPSLNGRVERIEARGPSALWTPRYVEPGKGHVGKVIREKRTHFVAWLSRDDREWQPIPGREHPQSVLTVPLPWDTEHGYAALQVQVPKAGAIRLDNRLLVEALAARAGAHVERLRRRQQSYESQTYSDSDITSYLMKELLSTASNPLQILDIRRRIYKKITEELKKIAGENCHSVTIRMYNKRRDSLLYVHCDGREWTKQLRDTVYRMGDESAGARAFRQDGPYYIHDVNARQIQYKRVLPSTQSFWAKRFSIHGEPWGVVSIDWTAVNGRKEGVEELFIQAITKLEDALSMLATREAALLHELGSSFSGRSGIKLATDNIVKRAKDVFGARACSLFLLDAKRPQLNLVGTTHPSTDPAAAYPVGEGLTGWVAKKKRCLRVYDTSNEGELQAIDSELRPSDIWLEAIDFDPETERFSFLAAPLLIGERLLGVIRLAVKCDGSGFSHEDESFLEDVSDRLATAIDRLLMEQAATEKLKRVEHDAEVGSRIAQAMEPAKICQVLTDEFMGNDDTATVHLLVIEQDRPLIEVASGLFKTLLADEVAVQVPRQQPDCVNFEDSAGWKPARDELRQRFPESYREWIGPIATAALPFSQGQYSGFLTVGWRRDSQMEDEKLNAVRAMAERASAAIEPSLRQERIRRGLQQLRETGLKFAATHNLAALMEDFLTQACFWSGMEQGAVRLYDKSTDRWVLWAKTPNSFGDAVVATNERLRTALKSVGPVYWPDPQDRVEWLEDFDKASIPECEAMFQIQTWLCIPLRANEECFGAITLESNRPQPISSEALEFLDILTQYAVVAIESARLYESQKQAIELAEPFALLGRMLDGFLHVIRNRLNNVQASFSLLSHPKLSSEERRGQQNRVDRNLLQLAQLCSDLEHFAGPGSKAREQISVVPLLDRITGDWRERAMSPKIDFEVPAQSSQGPLLLGNPLELEIAIRMLIQNAVEAIPNGGHIVARARDNGKHLTVSVSDDGMGMGADTKRRCLEPFFTTKRESGGTGLGLSIVYGIVKRNGGRMRCFTLQGKGTMFLLIFPSQREASRG